MCTHDVILFLCRMNDHISERKCVRTIPQKTKKPPRDLRTPRHDIKTSVIYACMPPTCVQTPEANVFPRTVQHPHAYSHKACKTCSQHGTTTRTSNPNPVPRNLKVQVQLRAVVWKTATQGLCLPNISRKKKWNCIANSPRKT